jgi:hypothetical protein
MSPEEAAVAVWAAVRIGNHSTLVRRHNCGVNKSRIILAVAVALALSACAHKATPPLKGVITIPSPSSSAALSIQLQPKGWIGVELGVPFVGAHEVTLQQAQNEVGFAIPRPDGSLASDGKITRVWVTTRGDTQIEIDYSSGVYVTMGPANPGMTDPSYAAEMYRKVAAQDGDQMQGLNEVTAVNGTPAYLVPDGAAVYASGQSQGAPGEVELVVGSETVEVVGHVSNDDLLGIASTIQSRST